MIFKWGHLHYFLWNNLRTCDLHHIAEFLWTICRKFFNYSTLSFYGHNFAQSESPRNSISENMALACFPTIRPHYELQPKFFRNVFAEEIFCLKRWKIYKGKFWRFKQKVLSTSLLSLLRKASMESYVAWCNIALCRHESIGSKVALFSCVILPKKG